MSGLLDVLGALRGSDLSLIDSLEPTDPTTGPFGHPLSFGAEFAAFTAFDFRQE